MKKIITIKIRKKNLFFYKRFFLLFIALIYLRKDLIIFND